MKRSNELRENAIVAAPVQPPIVRSISGVCSECGTTYQAEANNGDVAWMCPRCGPSTPINVKEPKAALTKRRRRPRWLRSPRLRVPFFLVQMLIVSLTFVVFMGLLLHYMNKRYPGRKNAGAAAVAQRAGVGAPSQRAPSLPRAELSRRDDPAGAGHVVEPPAVGNEQDAAASASRPNADGALAANSADATPTSSYAPPSSIPQNAIAPRAEGPSLVIDELPMSTADGCVMIREIVNAFPRWFGREVVLQCRLAKVSEDAVGQVPHRFFINDEEFMLSEQDESGYVRLEVVDARGETLPCVFAPIDGPLGRELQWIIPGDWLLLTATAGIRYEQTPSESWGLILIKVAALEENSHDRFDQATKKLAER